MVLVLIEAIHFLFDDGHPVVGQEVRQIELHVRIIEGQSRAGSQVVVVLPHRQWMMAAIKSQHSARAVEFHRGGTFAMTLSDSRSRAVAISETASSISSSRVENPKLNRIDASASSPDIPMARST